MYNNRRAISSLFCLARALSDLHFLVAVLYSSNLLLFHPARHRSIDVRNRLTSRVYLSQLLGQRALPLCDLSSFPIHFGQQGTIIPGTFFTKSTTPLLAGDLRKHGFSR